MVAFFDTIQPYHLVFEDVELLGAAGMLHDGGSLIESMLKSGLTHVEFNDLYKRLADWENEYLVKINKTNSDG